MYQRSAKLREETMSERPDIVPVGQVPELGAVPDKMHAYVIRPERFGEPKQSFQPEEAPVWELGPGEVLVQFMAAGVTRGLFMLISSESNSRK